MHSAGESFIHREVPLIINWRHHALTYTYMEVPLNLPIQGGSTYLYMEVPLTYKISTTYLFREVPLTYTLRHHLPIQGGTTYVPIQGGPTFLQGGITL